MKDLTKGNPTRLMLSFALPVCLGNIFQLFYSLADTRIVGSTLGNEALAAIGATTAITTLLIGFLQGLTNGFSIIVAQCFGAKQTDQLKKASAGTFLLSFITTILLTALALLFLNPLLHLLNVPQNLFDSASAYIRILLIGMLITMLYNALAGILRAVGDTVAPLLFNLCFFIKYCTGFNLYSRIPSRSLRSGLCHHFIPDGFGCAVFYLYVETLSDFPSGKSGFSS